jgi:hypothetical protein
MTFPLPHLSLEDEAQQFYAALGKAISQWQHVESALVITFTALTGSNSPRSSVVNAAFHSLISFKAKLDMVDTAFKTAAFMSPRESALLPEWKTLRNRISKRSDRRNELAHFSMIRSESRKPGYRFHLSPNAINVNAAIRHNFRPPMLNVGVITASGNAFEKVAMDIIALNAKLFSVQT